MDHTERISYMNVDFLGTAKFLSGLSEFKFLPEVDDNDKYLHHSHTFSIISSYNYSLSDGGVLVSWFYFAFP